ncbi:ASN_HP2_G0053890.mRNA.1.CDS.1 [Saccharomyces cerevisiae]|nr:BGN_3a_G0056370.mRNA.1.CDS.1 [Saccharomyces cerevisiae]CAI5323295.1 ASN_HP2_G0053890.mRNA.1.CDS.1 [Saccharomyces cerevisiae]CAI6738626.1 ASN_HP2_G0053890.mRNA.1.CDS.1 [Saccharomyces cerevisiae]CAI6751932.1 ASN_HP1_G0055250.mRNA.1.CDS.1 [Saccharomyces cerevisiae]CAI6840501.1 BFH_HP1_G0056840.mRNA.1.CDS.1 [Saccharomyces cerevisiae]
MVDVEEKSQEVEYVDPTVNRVPNYEVSEKAFLLTQSKVSIEQRKEAAEFVLAKIKEEEMAPYYKYLCEEYLVNNGQSDLEHDEKSDSLNEWIKFDQELYNELCKKNESKIKELNEKIQKLEEDDEGELEQAQAWINLGEYYAQIGDKDNAEKTLGKSLSKAISTGAKIDVMLTIARLGFFYNDQLYVKEKLEAVNSMIEKGGDWERRNRYKTYYGIHCLAVRNFKEAAKLLVDSLATFTSIELTSYESIAIYASVTGLFTLERTDLKSKVIDSPELLSLISTTAALQSISSLTISLYASDYASYFPYLLETYANVLIPCKYLNRHADFFVREMRRKVYAQLLESYKTLSLKSMASAFGVSVAFLDNDLGKFIPNKQLNCVIDRVNGIVETNRPDNKNAQYHLLVKQGDGLLTKLQKYGAAVRLTGSDRV